VMPSDLDEKFRNAQVLYRLGRLADAGKLCRLVLDLQPTNFDALHLLGIIASQTGEIGQAIELLGKAIGARPGSAEAYNSLGAVLAQLGRPEQALLSYAQATALQPDFAEAHINHSNMLREVLRPPEAVASHEAAIDCCSPGAAPVATRAVWARWHGANRCRQCTAAVLRCVDPDDQPAYANWHDTRNLCVHCSASPITRL
jgi:tetratricopeptide (TPR) repeat protein